MHRLRLRIYRDEQALIPAETGMDACARHLILFVDGRVAGGITVIEAVTEGGRPALRIGWLVVRPRLRNGFYAMCMMGICCEDAVARGIDDLNISVYDWKTGLIAFYESLGFRCFGSTGHGRHRKLLFNKSNLRTSWIELRARLFRRYRSRLVGVDPSSLPIASMIEL